MSNLKEKAQDYFDRFTNSAECHITSDGRIFHGRGQADSFASGLPDTEVKTFTRKDFEAEQIEVEGVVVLDTKGTDNENKEASFKLRVDELIAKGFTRIEDTFQKEDHLISVDDVYNLTDVEFLEKIASIESATEPLTGDAKLLGFDTTTASYPELKAIVAEFGITTPSLKAGDLIDGIVAAQETLKAKV